MGVGRNSFWSAMRHTDTVVGGAAGAAGKAGGGLFSAVRAAFGYGAGAVVGTATNLAKRPGAMLGGVAALGTLAAVAGTAAYVFRRPAKKDKVPAIPESQFDMAPAMPDALEMQAMQQPVAAAAPQVFGAHTQRVVDSRAAAGVGAPGIGA